VPKKCNYFNKLQEPKFDKGYKMLYCVLDGSFWAGEVTTFCIDTNHDKGWTGPLALAMQSPGRLATPLEDINCQQEKLSLLR
jgi:hypothetical protein